MSFSFAEAFFKLSDPQQSFAGSLFKMTLVVAGYDMNFYIIHRLFHTKALWQYHKLHHVPIQQMTWRAGTVGHWSENLVTFLGGWIIYFLCFPRISYLEQAIALIYVSLRAYHHHDNDSTDNSLLSLIFGDKHHIGHHLEPNHNFGAWWLDYIFGTGYKGELKLHRLKAVIKKKA